MNEIQRLTLLVFSIPLGLVIGSFANVCIFRLPRECMSIVKPRSRCPFCLNPIRWYHNIPVLSYIALGGKCAYCGAKISVRYLLVEVLTAGVFFGVAHYFLFFRPRPGDLESCVQVVFFLYFMSAMIILTIIDIDFRILPDELTLSGIIIGLLACLAFPYLHRGDMIKAISTSEHMQGLVSSALGAFIGGAVVYLIGFVGKLMFRKEAMGFGDVKYMAMIGAIVGTRGVFLTLLIAAFAGATYGVVNYVITKDRYLAFGPFISLGAGVVIFFGAEVSDFVHKLVQIGI